MSAEGFNARSRVERFIFSLLEVFVQRDTVRVRPVVCVCVCVCDWQLFKNKEGIKLQSVSWNKQFLHSQKKTNILGEKTLSLQIRQLYHPESRNWVWLFSRLFFFKGSKQSPLMLQACKFYRSLARTKNMALEFNVQELEMERKHYRGVLLWSFHYHDT